MKGLAKLPTLKGLDELTVIEPVMTVEERAKEEDARLRDWAQRVGEDRARRANDILKMGKRNDYGKGSSTLPELLAEAFLISRGREYLTQYDLGFARPDFVLLDQMPGMAVVWRVQGDYWHSGTGAADAAQKDRLLRHTVRGLPIMLVIDIWERKVNESDAVFEAALIGQEITI